MERTELLSAVCGPVQSVRPIQNGKFLIGCHSEGQQGKLSRCQSLLGGVGIQCRIPVPTVEGVIGPIPLGEWALKQIKADLLADGHRVAGVFRLKNRKGEPSRSVPITFEGCTLPTEVWIACTSSPPGVGLCGLRAALHEVPSHRPHQVPVPLAGDPSAL